MMNLCRRKDTIMKELLTVHDVISELGVSRSSAYKIIRALNEELQEKGYLVVSGKVPRRYFLARYCLDAEIAI